MLTVSNMIKHETDSEMIFSNSVQVFAQINVIICNILIRLSMFFCYF